MLDLFAQNTLHVCFFGLLAGKQTWIWYEANKVLASGLFVSKTLVLHDFDVTVLYLLFAQVMPECRSVVVDMTLESVT